VYCSIDERLVNTDNLELGPLGSPDPQKCVFSPTNQPKKKFSFPPPNNLLQQPISSMGKRKREPLVVVEAVNLFDFCRVEFKNQKNKKHSPIDSSRDTGIDGLGSLATTLLSRPYPASPNNSNNNNIPKKRAS
jgi:hypothetical protein